MVIAILAILALIAIPRFAGFTDKAKIQTDEQYAALVGNSAVVMLAAGDIEFVGTNTTGLISIDKDTGNATVVASVITGDFVGKIATLVNPKPLQYYSTLTVEVNEKGDHVIKTKTK